MAVDLLAPPAVSRRSSANSLSWLWCSLVLTLGSLGVAAALAPAIGADPSSGLAALLVLGSSVHIAATGWLFSFRDVRRHARANPSRYLFVPAVLVALGAILAAGLSRHDLDLALLAYFGWQFHHYQRQNLGITALAARSSRVASLTTSERRCLTTAGWLGVVGLVVRPEVLQLTTLDWHPALPFHVAALGFAACGLLGVGVLARRASKDRPAGFCATYLAALCFPLPIFLFSSPYAAVGGMTVAHGLQYLLLVGMVAGGPPTKSRVNRGLAGFAVTALVGGIAVNRLSHLHAGGAASRAVYGGYLGIVMTHFVLDAGLWRLRDPFPRQFLAARLPGVISR